MGVWPIADRDGRELTAQSILSLLLLLHLTRDLRQLLNCTLHSRQPPLQLTHCLEAEATLIA